MTEAQARLIMSEIHKISNYAEILKEYDRELVNIRKKLDGLQSLPSSGNFDKVKTENNHVEVSTKINELLSDEQGYIEQKSRLDIRYQLAVSYRKQVIAQTDSDSFMIDYMDRMSYRKLVHVHGWENPYEHMISVMRKLDIKF